MTFTLTRRALGVASLALLAVAPARAQQDWPNQPVTVVVPFAAGGATDAVARVLTHQLSIDLGQQFIVDNRAGATGTIGFAAVARSEPLNGYTLGLGPGSTLRDGTPPLQGCPTMPSARSRASDHRHSCRCSWWCRATSPLLPCPSSLSWRRRPGEQRQLRHAGAAPRCIWRSSSSCRWPRSKCKASVIAAPHWPFRDATGDTQMTLPPASAVMTFIKSGDVRPIAVSKKERSPIAPDVPDVAEQGFPGDQVVEEISLVAPAGTPGAFCAGTSGNRCRFRKSRDAEAASRPRRHAGRWPPRRLAAHIMAENQKWGEALKSRNIKME